MRTTSAATGAAKSPSAKIRLKANLENSENPKNPDNPENPENPENLSMQPSSLFCQWIRTQLEVHHFARGPFACLHVKRRSRAHGGPESLTFPSSLRIIDAAVHPLRIEARRIRHAQHDPLAILQHEQTLRGISRVDR